MDFIISLIPEIISIADLVVMTFVTTMVIDFMLDKSKGWFRVFCFGIVINLALTVLFTWIPARFGMQFGYLDGEVMLEDGAFFMNLGITSLAYIAGIGLALLKYIWACIRHKARFSFSVFLIGTVYIAVVGAAGIRLMQDERVIPYSDGIGVLCAAAFALIVYCVVKVLKAGSSGPANPVETAANDPEQVNTSATDQVGESNAQPAADTKAIAEFERVVAEKNRLTAQGDYASQIPMLIEATGLDLDPARKVKIWNYLGLAYRELGSWERGMECFRNALIFDDKNPSALNNLAQTMSENGDNAMADQLMVRSIAEAEKRGLDMGLFYGNYALIEGRLGLTYRMEEYLQKAAAAGLDAESIQTIRKKALLSNAGKNN